MLQSASQQHHFCSLSFLLIQMAQEQDLQLKKPFNAIYQKRSRHQNEEENKVKRHTIQNGLKILHLREPEYKPKKKLQISIHIQLINYKYTKSLFHNTLKKILILGFFFFFFFKLEHL